MAQLLPDALRAGFQITGGGDENKLTCNFKLPDGKLAHSVVIDCGKGALATFAGDQAFAEKSEMAIANLGRSAYPGALGPRFRATKVDCIVSVASLEVEAGFDGVAFGQAVDAVLTPSTTPWPPRP